MTKDQLLDVLDINIGSENFAHVTLENLASEGIIRSEDHNGQIVYSKREIQIVTRSMAMVKAVVMGIVADQFDRELQEQAND